jgi:hypothetical protein
MQFLTIQPGTIIKGGANKASLIITRNGSIIANGTKESTYCVYICKGSRTKKQRRLGWCNVILGKSTINRPTDCTTCPGSAVAASEAGVQNAVEGDLDNASGDALYGGTD